MTLLVGNLQSAYFEQQAAANLNLPMGSSIQVGQAYEHKRFKPPALKNMYVTPNYIEEVDSPASNDFKKRFKAKFPNEPYISQEAANAYDAVYIYKAAVEKACEILKASGAKRALPLPVSAPFHSSLMSPAAQRLKEKLATTTIATPTIPVVNNIDVTVQTDVDSIRDALYRQAFGPVRWVECVAAIKARGVHTLVECGPGKVLAGLTKRIDADLTGLPLFDPASLAEVKMALA